MRKDMSKVIVERPRSGAGRLRRQRHVDPDDEQHVGMRRDARMRGGYKGLNENLAPLRRWLERQVGRPWGTVWSELCENLRVDSAVQKHVRDHVADFVAVTAFEQDGELHVQSRWRGPVPLRESFVRLYVDPETELLRRNPHHGDHRRAQRRRRAASAAERAARMRELSPWRQLHLLDDGAWWQVDLASAPARRDGVPAPVDVVLRAGLSRLDPGDLYGRGGVIAVAKRQLSKREMRAAKLR